MFNKKITETDTDTIFALESLVISNTEENKEIYDKISKMNKRYEIQLLKNTDSDLFSTAETQTRNPPLKERSMMANPPQTESVSCQVTKWSIYDAYDSKQNMNENNDNEEKASDDFDKLLLRKAKPKKMF